MATQPIDDTAAERGTTIDDHAMVEAADGGAVGDQSDPTSTDEKGARETASEATRSIPHARAVILMVSVGVIALGIDILTKQLAVAHLTEGSPVHLIRGVANLELIRNSGAAFSMGTGYTFVFPVITLGVIGWISWMASRLRSLPWAISLGLVLGGAFGNLTDRVFREPGPFVGHVVDFVSIPPIAGYSFPIFNAADSALVTGVILAVILELTGRRRDGSRMRH